MIMTAAIGFLMIIAIVVLLLRVCETFSVK